RSSVPVGCHGGRRGDCGDPAHRRVSVVTRGGHGGSRVSGSGAVKIFLWHVHGSWTTAFVQGDHEYLVPVLPDRGPDGRGRARTWVWPASVVEVTAEEAARADVDVVLLQRPEELLGLAEQWLGGRRPGR